MDIGIHMIDQALFLMGDVKPISAFGHTNKQVGPRKNIRGTDSNSLMAHKSIDASVNVSQDGAEDFAGAIVRFENGTSLHVDVSWTMHRGSDRISTEVFGSKGGLVVDPILEVYGECHDYVNISQPVIADMDSEFVNAFNNEMQHFANCVLYGEPCKSSINDGVKVMAVIDAIYESHKTGISVAVKL